MTMMYDDMPPTGAYRSYLVRFWQSNAQGSWRASAQCVQTGGTMLFGDAAGLLTFLQSQISDDSAAPQPSTKPWRFLEDE